MTVTYTLDVATSSGLSDIPRLLFRWRGSVWKAVWKELAVWLVAFALISAVYRFVLSVELRSLFERTVQLSSHYSEQVPLTFVLGFYVSEVLKRWWNMYLNIGKTEQNSLMTAEEKCLYDSIISPQKKYYVPIYWAMAMLQEANDEGRIRLSEDQMGHLFQVMERFRASTNMLTNYDSTPIPLVYTQLVCVIVRLFFLVALVKSQFVDPTETAARAKKLAPHNNATSAMHTVSTGWGLTDEETPKQSAAENAEMIDLYVPVLTVFIFIFYMGWLKVAEALLNPFGEDDDDFELNWYLDKNLQIGFAIVDDVVGKVPSLKKDVFWGDTSPEPLYTEETADLPVNVVVGSATNFFVNDKGEEIRGSEDEAGECDENRKPQRPPTRPISMPAMVRRRTTKGAADKGATLPQQPRYQNYSMATINEVPDGSPSSHPIVQFR